MPPSPAKRHRPLRTNRLHRCISSLTNELKGWMPRHLRPLVALTEQEFRRRFCGSPILRAKRRGFLRNVAVALGRIGTAEAFAELRRSLGIEEDAHVKVEIEEATSEAEKSCAVVPG